MNVGSEVKALFYARECCYTVTGEVIHRAEPLSGVPACQGVNGENFRNSAAGAAVFFQAAS